ncbi:tRNA 2-selenouridine(34) synthase MnmH [Granulosicoccus sp.]|nr:tRNA 2-selenouridine(34) synthase MnmH [Granulosicoccus sp.]MDB4224323.1 tRNA 2-selenouridine(34) synthase MnmH [Granulosicoccus sp.]
MNIEQERDSESLVVPEKSGATRDDFHEIFLNDIPLLDVRAPVEFTKGAFPNSINHPLMSDEERHLVGIRYKEAGQKSAIKLGAELVNQSLRAQRIELWKNFAEQYPEGALYCFRGGLRSRITQQWLIDAGVQLPLVTGGYKALRTFLINTLEDHCESMNITLIGGRTGNGKTLLINKIGNTLDLEGLANHRGSSFGNLGVEQPSNIDFENSVTVELMKLNNKGISQLYLEDEARLIGRVCIPEVLVKAMHRAPIAILECDMPTRIQNCMDDYVFDLLNRYSAQMERREGFIAFRSHHRNSLSRIRKRFGLENYSRALELLESAMDKHESLDDVSGYEAFIELLLREYYDPMYDYQLNKKIERVTFKGSAEEILDWAAR